MKNFVKVLAILLAIFMALAVFAACGKKNDDKPDDKPADTTPVDDKPADDTPAHEHAWGEGKVTKEATCTEEGEKTFTCSGCNETKTEKIAALGHTWDEGKVTKEATVNAEGEKLFTCTVCGETKTEKIEKVPAPSVENPDTKYYKLQDDGTYIFYEYYGEETDVTVEAILNGRKVVAIGERAFSTKPEAITSVTIENGIKTIGEAAFEGCTGLTEIVIPDSVTEIGENAFKDCTGLISVKLGAGTETIPENAFANCAKIEFIDLGDGLQSLKGTTFFLSSMTLVKVVIGKNMENLNKSFEDAVEFGKLVVIENNSESEDFTAGPNVKALLDKIADAKEKGVDVAIEIDKNGYVFYLDENGEAALISYIGGGQKLDPEDDEEKIDPAKKVLVLPKSAGEAELTYKIYRYAFKGRTDIAKVVFSEGVTAIDEYAFAVTALQELNLPKSVTKIGLGIVAYCDALTVITVADGNTVYSAAGNCLIETAKKTVIAGCEASEIPTDSAKVTKIGANAFEGLGITSIAIPANVTEIGKEAFCSCANLATINYAGTRTAWVAVVKGTDWDADTGSYTVVCSNGNFCKEAHNFSAATVIYTAANAATCGDKGNNAYFRCTVCGTYFDAGKNVTDATEATEFDIPATGHADPVYGHCPTCGDVIVPASTGLTYNYYHTDPNYCYLNGYDTEFSGTELVVPATTTKDTVDYKVTGVIWEAFRDLTTLKYVILTDNVTEIRENAFDGCTALESIELYNSLTIIYEDAFKGCSSLTSITFHGTQAEWLAVTKVTGWDASAGSYTVHCSDGDIVPLS